MKHDIVILSPHPDDACFSLGGSILKHKDDDITVWNIFSRQEFSILKEDSNNALERIKAEELEVCHNLQVSVVFEDYPEAGLRGFQRLSEIIGAPWPIKNNRVQEQQTYNSLISKIESFLINKNHIYLGLPLGSGAHIDHLMCREAALHVLNNSLKAIDCNVFFYEDLPYSINQSWLDSAIGTLKIRGYKLKPMLLDISNYVAKKEYIMSLYKSQIKQRDIKKMLSYAKEIEPSKYCERIWILET